MGVSEAPAQARSREILDVLTGVVKQAAAISHSIAAGFGLTPPDLMIRRRPGRLSQGWRW